MKLKNLIAIAFVLLTCFEHKAQVQCAVDIVILEGASIAFCEDAPISINGSNGFVSYAWTEPFVVAAQSTVPTTSGQYVLSAVDGIGCVSYDTIDVTINPLPTPTIISSEGNPICTSPGGSMLSLANPYVSYDWGFGFTTPTFFASGAGAYAVTVTDANGCSGQTVLTLTEVQFGLTSTATSGCYGASTTIQASGGGTYLWSTGETGSSIVVNPASATNFSVTITNGSCVEVLNTTVNPVEGLDWEMPDTIYLGVGQQETIEGPPGFDSYLWSPAEIVNNPFSYVVIVTGSTSQILTMEATHPSGCVLTDQTVIIVVDLTIPDGFSPNGDSYNQFFEIPELMTQELDAKIQVWNRWGELVLDEENYKNTWEGTCETTLCLGNEQLPEGTYFYHIEAKKVTFEGYITLKK